jgi:hypothetical protein
MDTKPTRRQVMLPFVGPSFLSWDTLKGHPLTVASLSRPSPCFLRLFHYLAATLPLICFGMVNTRKFAAQTASVRVPDSFFCHILTHPTISQSSSNSVPDSTLPTRKDAPTPGKYQFPRDSQTLSAVINDIPLSKTILLGMLFSLGYTTAL